MGETGGRGCAAVHLCSFHRVAVLVSPVVRLYLCSDVLASGLMAFQSSSYGGPGLSPFACGAFGLALTFFAAGLVASAVIFPFGYGPYSLCLWCIGLLFSMRLLRSCAPLQPAPHVSSAFMFCFVCSFRFCSFCIPRGRVSFLALKGLLLLPMLTDLLSQKVPCFLLWQYLPVRERVPLKMLRFVHGTCIAL